MAGSHAKRERGLDAGRVAELPLWHYAVSMREYGTFSFIHSTECPEVLIRGAQHVMQGRWSGRSPSIPTDRRSARGMGGHREGAHPDGSKSLAPASRKWSPSPTTRKVFHHTKAVDLIPSGKKDDSEVGKRRETKNRASCSDFSLSELAANECRTHSAELRNSSVPGILLGRVRKVRFFRQGTAFSQSVGVETQSQP